MVEFIGKIDNDIQAKIITKRSQFLGVIGIIIAIILLVIGLIIWLVEKKLDSELIRFMIFSIACVVLYGAICIPTSRKRLRFELDYNIKFGDGTITQISNHQNGVSRNYKISKVKKVVDYGKFYYLYLYRLDPSYGIVCQKDLLIDGRIEEFEKLFEGKIKRKLK